MRDYGEVIEADLAFRGIDLLDFYRGRMSARRLWVLVRNLPPDSLTVGLIQGTVQPTGEQQPDKSNVRYLEDIPKVSLRDAQSFVNAPNDQAYEQMSAG